VNLTVFLGDDLVLRLPRTDRAAVLLSKEAEVIHLVRGAGVPTPALVEYDASGRIVDVPYMLLERARGRTLAEVWTDPKERQRAVESLGQVLVTLHRFRRSTTGAEGSIPSPYVFDPTEVVDRLIAAGEIGTSQGHWLLEQFAALQPSGLVLTDPVLVHRDVSPSNVIVGDNGQVEVLLDWGLAEWGTPARDLVGLPLSALPDLLSGYRTGLEASGVDATDRADLTLERDALWLHLYLALTRLLKEPSTSEDRHWAAPRSATLIDILAFIAERGAKPWPELLYRHASRSGE
jgi:aminoglycoside phosphotransferase (APT) family kinase protein